MIDVLDNIAASLKVTFFILIIEKLSNSYANFIYNCKDGNLLFGIFHKGIVVVYIKVHKIDVRIFLNYMIYL